MPWLRLKDTGVLIPPRANVCLGLSPSPASSRPPSPSRPREVVGPNILDGSFNFVSPVESEVTLLRVESVVTPRTE